jgi:hypothetical protein
MAALSSNIFVSFSKDTFDPLHLITHPQSLTNNGISLLVDDRTTGIALKEIIAQNTGAPQDHISLILNTGSYRSTSLTSLSAESFHSGTERAFGDEELVQPALQKPQESLNSHHCMGPSISFSLHKCSDLSHCPTILKVNQLTGPLGVFPFGQSTTVSSLKETIAHQFGTPVEQQRFIFKGEQLPNESTLSALGVGHGSVISLVPRMVAAAPDAVD